MHSRMRPSPLVRFVLVLAFVGGVIALTLCLTKLPPAVAEGAPATEFSSVRALKHLSVIAQRPHPVGSAEHQVVRDYLVRELSRLNGPPEIQTAARDNQPPLQNILLRLKGSNSRGKALMLTAHYDSVASGPGASDDGSGVVTLLETLRALKAGAPLKNDVIFLFTDGEELPVLGARAFIDKNPSAKDVGLVLNFEARGTSGPVFMFETSKSNGTLIKELSHAAPRPFTNSLMGDLYKLLPNTTDLTVFKAAGLPGLNFAYIDSAWNYHKAGDNLSNIDERSIQHQGSYALALTRRFGDRDLQNIEAPDVIYFDVLGRKVFSYPQTWNLPLTVILVLFAAGVSILGLRAGRARFSRVIFGMLLFAGSTVCAVIVAMLLSKVLPRAGPSGVYYLWILLLLITSMVLLIYAFAARRIRLSELSMGALLVLVLLAVAVNLLLPGGSFLLTWPLIFSLISLGVSLVLPERLHYLHLVIVAVCSIPGIVLFTQMIDNVFQGFSLSAPHVLVIIEMLLLGLLTPFLTGWRRLDGGTTFVAD